MNQTLDASNQEACKAQFRAEMADKEIARLKMNWSVLFVVREGPLRRRFIAPIGEERERGV